MTVIREFHNLNSISIKTSAIFRVSISENEILPITCPVNRSKEISIHLVLHLPQWLSFTVIEIYDSLMAPEVHNNHLITFLVRTIISNTYSLGMPYSFLLDEVAFKITNYEAFFTGNTGKISLSLIRSRNKHPWNYLIYMVFTYRHCPYLLTMTVKHIIAHKKFIMPITINIYCKWKMSCILITLEMPHNLQIIIKGIHSAITVFYKNITRLVQSSEITYSHSVRIDSVKGIHLIWNTYYCAILSSC